MALSFKAVQKGYEVFNELKKTVLPDLNISSWPEDIARWSEDEEKKRLKEKVVYGCDKKSDDGWENLIFFVRDPSEELKAKFDELKSKVPNSSISKPYSANNEFWIFGWF